MNVAQLDRRFVQRIVHREPDRLDGFQFAERAPHRHPKRIRPPIRRRREVGAVLVAADKVLEWNRGAQPYVLTERLQLDAARTLRGVDPQGEPLRRGSFHVDDEVREPRPVGGQRGSNFREREFPFAQHTVEGQGARGVGSAGGDGEERKADEAGERFHFAEVGVG